MEERILMMSVLWGYPHHLLAHVGMTTSGVSSHVASIRVRLGDMATGR